MKFPDFRILHHSYWFCQWTKHQPCPGTWTQAEGPVFSVQRVQVTRSSVFDFTHRKHTSFFLLSSGPSSRDSCPPGLCLTWPWSLLQIRFLCDTAGGLQGELPSRPGRAGTTFRGPGLFLCLQSLFNNGACVCLKLWLVAQLGAQKYSVSLCYFRFRKQQGSEIQNDIFKRKSSPSPPELCRWWDALLATRHGGTAAARMLVKIHACFLVVGVWEREALRGTGRILLRTSLRQTTVWSRLNFLPVARTLKFISRR